MYKTIDRTTREVLYGEQQNLRLDDVRLLLDATLKAEAQRLPGEWGSETEPTGGYV